MHNMYPSRQYQQHLDYPTHHNQDPGYVVNHIWKFGVNTSYVNRAYSLITQIRIIINLIAYSS